MKIFRKGIILCLVINMVLITGCGSKKAQGKITGAYQPMRSGMVQMYIEVELDDGSEVSARLPVDQKVWDRVSSNVRSGRQPRVEIKHKGKDQWEFVRFLED